MTTSIGFRFSVPPQITRSLIFLTPIFFTQTFLPLPAYAQINTTGSTNCTAADFDTDVQFFNGPGEQFSLLIHKRNIGSKACIFDGPAYGPSLVPDGVEGQKPFGLCYFCEDRLPNGQVPMRPPISAAPGQVALQTFRWRTKPENDTIHCVTLQWMAGPILLVTPSLLKPVCSDVDVSRFTLEAANDAAASQKTANPPAGFELSVERGLYYMRESFSLKLAPIPGSPAIAPSPESCPTFYLRERSPDGNTRIDEVKPITSVGCKTFMPGRRPINSDSSFEIDSGANSRWERVGEHKFQIRQLVGSADDPRIEFVSSTVLRLQIADPAMIARKWGGRAKGIGVDVTLEKDTYHVGENIPLHIAVEDFDAPVAIYTWDPLWDPCMTVGVQVLDTEGHPLPQNERFSDQFVCMGHGLGPRPIQKGKLVPIESTLAGEGWLPNHSGNYTVRVRWAPCGGKEPPPSGLVLDDKTYKTYAEVQADVTIRIVPAETDSEREPNKTEAR